MNKYLDLTTILKDCPKGMELDCTMYDNVTLESVSNDTDNSYPICIETKCGFSIRLTKYGQNVCLDDAKCVIFPKGKTTWEGFVPPCNFKDGDILSYQNKSYKNHTIYIYKYHSKMNTSYYVALSGCSDSNFLINDGRYGALDNYNDTVRFATEEEKQKLFQAIKDNGYNWNEETKTLEKLIVPKFKVGDIIRHAGEDFPIKIIDIKNNQYHIECFCDKYDDYKNGIIPVLEQNNYMLFPKFNPKNLKPFDKVLVRDREQGDWRINMNKYLDLTTILKNCPRGMELDCTVYEDVYFDYVDELNIIHCYVTHETNTTALRLNQHGTLNSDIKSKCVIFPKGKTTWEGFVPPFNFKDGDIVYLDFGYYYKITIFKRQYREFLYYHASLMDNNILSINTGNSDIICTSYLKEIRFATEEEKQKLFDAIKANGYKWDSDTKTLDKLIVPKFKVGDRITNGKTSITIGYIDNEYYYEIGRNVTNRLSFKNQDEWKLVPNKFDTKALNHFDKVLVRQYDLSAWCVDFFSYYDKEGGYAVCTGESHYDFCVPYNDDTKHLVGKFDDAPEFYRYWEK